MTKAVILMGPRDGRHSRPPHAAPPGEALGQEAGEALGHGLCWGFHGKSRQDRVNDSGLVTLNNFDGLWAIGVAPGLDDQGRGMLLLGAGTDGGGKALIC